MSDTLVDIIDLTKRSAERLHRPVRDQAQPPRTRLQSQATALSPIVINDRSSPTSIDDGGVVNLLSDDDDVEPIDLTTPDVRARRRPRNTGNIEPLDLSSPVRPQRRAAANQTSQRQSQQPANPPTTFTEHTPSRNSSDGDDDVLVSVTTRRRSSDDVIVIDKNPPAQSAVTNPNDEDKLTPKRRLISCPVCLDHERTIRRTGRHTVSTACGHIFCNECIERCIAANKCCPTCRKKLTKKQFHPIFL